MARKFPAFIDLDRGIMGTFAGLDAEQSEDGYVYPKYAPFNSFKVFTYSNPVPRECVHSIVVPQTGIKGTESEIVFIFGSDENSVVKKFLTENNSAKIKSIESENKRLKLNIATLQQELRESSQSPEAYMARAEALTRSKKEREREAEQNREKSRTTLLDDL